MHKKSYKKEIMGHQEDIVKTESKIIIIRAGGDNITVAGNTVKLYPTRKTNDNIYCTVE